MSRIRRKWYSPSKQREVLYTTTPDSTNQGLGDEFICWTWCGSAAGIEQKYAHLEKHLKYRTILDVSIQEMNGNSTHELINFQPHFPLGVIFFNDLNWIDPKAQPQEYGAFMRLLDGSCFLRPPGESRSQKLCRCVRGRRPSCPWSAPSWTPHSLHGWQRAKVTT
jgi:hypothetical protein